MFDTRSAGMTNSHMRFKAMFSLLLVLLAVTVAAGQAQAQSYITVETNPARGDAQSTSGYHRGTLRTYLVCNINVATRRLGIALDAYVHPAPTRVGDFVSIKDDQGDGPYNVQGGPQVSYDVNLRVFVIDKFRAVATFNHSSPVRGTAKLTIRLSNQIGVPDQFILEFSPTPGYPTPPNFRGVIYNARMLAGSDIRVKTRR